MAIRINKSYTGDQFRMEREKAQEFKGLHTHCLWPVVWARNSPSFPCLLAAPSVKYGAAIDDFYHSIFCISYSKQQHTWGKCILPLYRLVPPPLPHLATQTSLIKATKYLHVAKCHGQCSPSFFSTISSIAPNELFPPLEIILSLCFLDTILSWFLPVWLLTPSQPPAHSSSQTPFSGSPCLDLFSLYILIPLVNSLFL